MHENLKINADRFMGFADIYDSSRPQPPEKAIEIISKYLGKSPELVVDLGCGTGLSSFIWSGVSVKVIGVEPSSDMRGKAIEKAEAYKNVRFISGYADNTGLQEGCADVITCSQSFHWMNPETTLNEVSRLLKNRGVFAVYDCDWPPVCNWEVEREFNRLFDKVREYESKRPELKNSFKSWPKDEHLSNMKKSGKFQFVREIVFSKSEQCDAERFINIALSQGGLQSIIKAGINEFEPYIAKFREFVFSSLGDQKHTIDFSYRMRIGVK